MEAVDTNPACIGRSIPDALTQIYQDLEVLGDACEKTEMYQNSTDKTEEFWNMIQQGRDPGQQVKALWDHLLQKIGETNNTLIIEGTIVLVMPLLCRAMLSYINS